MGTDHLDLWQIHDVRTRDDIEAISARAARWKSLSRRRKRAT